MSRPDDQLSTRDLASTPAEPRGETDATEDREDVETSTRDHGTPEAAEPTPAAPAPDETDHDRADRDADVAEPSAEQAEPAPDAGHQAQLLAEDEGAELGSRWEAIQVTFVDDPRRAVEEADGLVAHVMQQLADGFARERETLEGQWSRGEDVSTEDLRVALQRYRSFFQRLLSA
jgi:hypothetical protein